MHHDRFAPDAPDVRDALTLRRNFLREAMLLTMPALFGGPALPAFAAAFDPPRRMRSSARVNVRETGARGDGVSDDTDAFENAISALPSDGGTVHVPAGSYLIDAVRSVQLRSRMHLELAPDAKLIAKATDSVRYNVVLVEAVDDVEISGGQIIGERDRHEGTGGEAGHGIRVRGAERVTIRDIRISKGWGDGITVGPRRIPKRPFIVSRDVVLARVVCSGNRRNALSIGNVIGMKVHDSEFSDTRGTAPQCGIDVEPDRDPLGNSHCDDVFIENCVMRRNAKNGLQMWRLARGVTVRNCIMEDNGVCGILSVGAEDVVLTGNTVRRNRSAGAFIGKGNHRFRVSDNTFYENFSKDGLRPRAARTLVGADESVKKDLKLAAPPHGGTDIEIGKNVFR